MSLIPRDVLLTHFVSRPTYPVGSVPATVAEYVFKGLVLWGHILQRKVAVETDSWGVYSLSGFRRWVECVNNGSVYIASSHSELVYFGWDMTCVARHVLLVKVHLAIPWAK